MDLLRIAGEESLDLPDLTFGLNDVPTGLLNELTGAVLQAQGDGSIVSGFVPAAQSPTGPVTIGQDGVRNVALLGYQTGQGVTYGVLTVGGAAAQSFDLSSYAPGTYRIYVRFDRLPAEQQTRTFWSGVDQAEYQKTTATRLSALWEARIEVALPAPEWLAIGTVVVTSQGGGQGVGVQVTDQRPLYFEGSAAAGYAPTWGSDADRGNRQVATITDLRTMLDALKASLVDLKGRGLVGWASRYTAGTNIGSRLAGTNPIADRLTIGDSSFYLQGDANAPKLAFAGPDHRLEYAGGNTLRLVQAGAITARFSGGNAALGAALPNFISPNQPLVVAGNAPNGRVAQFAHTGGGRSSISIGSTDNSGGSIEFTGASASDFSTVGWSIYARSSSIVDFSIGTLGGAPFAAIMNDAVEGWVTTVRGDVVRLQSGTGTNQYVRANRLAVGASAEYVVAPSGLAWMTLRYDLASNQYFADRTNAGPVTVAKSGATFLVTTTAAMPANALVLVSCDSGSGGGGVAAAYEMVSNQQVRVRMFNQAGGDVTRSFDLVICHGPTGSGQAASGT